MNDKGFTLIELLAVIALIAIIASVGIYAVSTYTNKAKSGTNEVLINNVRTGAQLYIDECTSGVSSLNSVSGACIVELDSADPSKKEYYMSSVSLQDLATYNYLSATNNVVFDSSQNDIGECRISIRKIVSLDDYSVIYQVKSIMDSVGGIDCPVVSGEDY